MSTLKRKKSLKTNKPLSSKQKPKNSLKDTSDKKQLKKTGFKNKPLKWNEGKRKIEWKAGKPKETKGLFDHLKKESKKAEWERIKKEITPFFIENNLYNFCEIRLPNCVGGFKLSFAHSKKREDWAKDEPQRGIDAREVVRACAQCHDEIEYPEVDKSEGESGKQIMYEIVVETIRKRNERLKRS